MAQAPKPARKTSDIAEWYAAQYEASVGLAKNEGGARFKSFVGTFPVPMEMKGQDSYPITGRLRVMSKFLTLKLRYPLGPDGYSCLALSAKVDGVSTHFAYAYWRRGREGDEPEYICVAPTFDSQDGEYRRNFIRGPVFLAAYKKHMSKLAVFEEAVLALLGGALELRATTYPEAAAEHTAAQAGNLRLPVLAFVVAVALDLWEHERKLLATHTGKAYTAVMAAIARMHPNLAAESGRVQADVMVFRQGGADLEDARCGQKLVPMYTREAMQVLDYNLAAWRELAVTRLASDLVLNFVSPSFAFYNQWSYIEAADAALFENPAMEKRYARGRAVEVAARSLREARRVLGDAAAEQNYHTEELGARLYESLEYAQSFMLMSPVALMHTMEDVGWSLRSVPGIVRRMSNVWWPSIAESFARPDEAAHRLFELAYGAHCLHTKLGVAHTDLHGNNMTLYIWGYASRAQKGEQRACYSDPVVAYVAGPRGEADTYVFPAAGASACIIDYSRCILGPAFRARLEEGRAPSYATNFYRDQVNRVMRALHRYAPEYVAGHQNAIKAAVLANFEAVFPILCAVDFIAIGASIGAMLEEAAAPIADEVRPFVVARGAAGLALRLEAAGREALITGLHGLTAPAGARPAAKAPAFPGETILERVFGEWLFPRWAARDPSRARAAQLVDAYNYNNEVRHSSADYAAYPPWARLDEIERHLGEHKITDLFERGVEPFLEALRPGARVEVIADQIRAQQEKLDGRPVSAASSWLDE